MIVAQQLANHFRAVYFSGSAWTNSSLKGILKDISWEEANQKVQDLNTILALVYHIHYYVRAQLKVFKEGILDARDMYSFDHPAIDSQEDWELFLTEIWKEGEAYAAYVEVLTNQQLQEDFVESQYGSYYRNIQGLIEHTNYHLGQIAIIKKLIKNSL